MISSTAKIHEASTIHQTVWIDEHADIAKCVQIWHFCHISKNVKIGSQTILGQNVMIGANVSIGKNCKIQNNVSIYQGVTIESNVFCGPSCVFTNVLNPRADVDRKNEFKQTLVREGATIGANATIVCGVTLGSYCMIAAGAVVTKDIPDFALYAGVPAKKMGWVSKSGERLEKGLVCPRTGEMYRELNGVLFPVI